MTGRWKLNKTEHSLLINQIQIRSIPKCLGFYITWPYFQIHEDGSKADITLKNFKEKKISLDLSFEKLNAALALRIHLAKILLGNKIPRR